MAEAPSSAATGGSEPIIDNHLLTAILVTLFCCLPFGILAIVEASKVHTLLLAGNRGAALEASRRADLWVGWSIGGAIAFWGLYGIFVGIASS